MDRCLLSLDSALTTLSFNSPTTERAYPAKTNLEPELSESERKHAAGLMRVNHAGEIAAQGLYQGQAITARNPATQARMEEASKEENDHLEWCYKRLEELDSAPSKLAPLWFFGSFAIGATAGLIGDKWSLGFVAETEDQVVKHLDQHFDSLPEQDQRSRAIIKQMREDEARHADKARDAGGVELPLPVKNLMNLTSKIMTKSAYKI